MTKVYGTLFVAFAAFAIWGALRTHNDRKLEITAGRTTICFLPQVLEANKIRLTENPSAEGDKASNNVGHGYRIDFSTLKFSLTNGTVAHFDGGSFSHKGGFRLTCGNKSVDADQFIVSPSTKLADGLQLTVATGKEAFTAMDLVHGGATYSIPDKQLRVATLDMILTLRCAQELGRPDLAGLLVGSLKVFADSDPIDGGGDVEPPGNNPEPRTPGGLDVSTSDMGQLTWLGRVGTFPNGTNAFAMSTTSCNVGGQRIPWNAPMATTHPVIAMQIYRISNGRFEEVGWSWLKHGFFALNTSLCGVCHDPGGSFLGLACSDTYGVSNNDDQFYLGGRDEVNGFTGVWTCQGSWFSNFVNDCTRRNSGSGLSVVDHRLQVVDSDLGVSGAQYYYEARYITPNDVNTYNNVASRQATFSWSGSSWIVNTVDSGETPGPAINRWGELRSTAQPQTEGDVIVGVQTTNLGGGMWRYEYAVYNHTSDRQVRQFSVPMPNGMTVQNIGFHDIDTDSTNNWVGTYANNSVTWSTGTFGSSSANPLKYSSVFNFRFDANVQPVASVAQLGLFKPGSGPDTKAVTKAPVLLQPINSMSIINGTIASGDQSSLSSSDDNRLRLRATLEGARSGVGVQTSITAPPATVNTLIVGVESNNSLPLTVGAVQTVRLWNWTTSAWELVDTRPTTQTDSIALVTITSNAERFINSSTREVQAQVVHIGNTAGSPYRSLQSFDQIGFQFNN